jgi:HSP20 family protein
MTKPDTSIETRGAGDVPAKEIPRARKTYSPAVDIVESPDDLILRADMPGVDPKGIDIRFEEGELTLFGKVVDRPQEGRCALLHEVGVGDFLRVFEISEAIDVDKVSAEYRHGVLTLTLPKVEAVKPRKIVVKTA